VLLSPEFGKVPRSQSLREWRLGGEKAGRRQGYLRCRIRFIALRLFPRAKDTTILTPFGSLRGYRRRRDRCPSWRPAANMRVKQKVHNAVMIFQESNMKRRALPFKSSLPKSLFVGKIRDEREKVNGKAL